MNVHLVSWTYIRLCVCIGTKRLLSRHVSEPFHEFSFIFLTFGDLLYDTNIVFEYSIHKVVSVFNRQK